MAVRDATLPDLQLHDILNNLSPSPTPLRLDSAQDRPRSITPEILTEADVAQMRHRVVELRDSSQGLLSPTERETELSNMVLRLTESTFIDPDQLIRQAEVISCLTAQRDFLIRQTEEERERWASQQDGWDRMAEALVAQRSKSLSGPTKEDIDRYCAAYQSENKTLREKLSDTSSRLQHLESEITKLRPILLMQPVTTASAISHHTSHLSGVPYPSIQAATEKVKSKRKKKKEPRVPVFSAHVPDEQELQEQIETQPMEDIEKTTASSSFFQFQAQPILPPTTQPTFTGDHYRKPTATPVGGPLTAPPTTLEFQVSTPPQPPKTVRTIRRSSPQPADTKPSDSTLEPLTPGRSGPIPKKSKRIVPPTSVTSDARTEHILLAARKIGRERAGIVAGYVRDRKKEFEMQKHEREREKTAREFEREQAEKERLNRFAERGAGGLSYYRRDVVEAGLSNSGKVGPESSPQTPRKDGSGLCFGRNASGSPAPPGPRVKTVSMSIEALARGKGKAPQKPQMANGNAPDTSQQQQRHAAGTPAAQQTQPQTNPSTPLSSLIDAARMIDGNDETGVQAHNGGSDRRRKNGISSDVPGRMPGQRRGVVSIEQSESPAPKRRRIATARAVAAAAVVTKSGSSSKYGSGSGSGSGSRNGNGGEREGVDSAMTALHVLADQAAAFSSHDLRGKGKAREVQDDEDSEDDDGEEDADYAPTSSAGTRRGRRGRQPVKEREKEKTKSNSALTRKTRGKTAAVIPAAAPRLISSPAPKSFAGSLPPGDGCTVSTTTPTTGNAGICRDKSLGPTPVISAHVSQSGKEDRNLTLNTPSPGRGLSEEEHLAGALLELAPPIEIQSRSLHKSPFKGDVSGTIQAQQSRPEEFQKVVAINTSGDPSAPDSAKVTADDDGRAPMDVDMPPITGESEEIDADDYEPVIDLLLQPDADEDEDERTEPASGTLDSAPHDPPSNMKDGGGTEDGEADAEGEVDAEGEIDLEDESPSQTLLDSTVTIMGESQSLPVDDQQASQQQARP